MPRRLVVPGREERRREAELSSFEEHVTNFWRTHGGRIRHTPENEQIVRVVNERIDQFGHFDAAEEVRFRTLMLHRRYLHHREWIEEYAAVVYGEVGRLAAEQHVLDDCGHVPRAVWYWLENGPINELGQLRRRL